MHVTGNEPTARAATHPAGGGDDHCPDSGHPPGWRRIATRCGAPATLLGCFLGLALLRHFDRSPGLFYTVLFAAYTALVFSARRRPRQVSWREMIAVAAVARLLVLWLPLSLSDDLYRYVWDGRVLAAGADPYLTSPDDPSLASLRDELWELTAHRSVESVYPPLAQTAFRFAAAWPDPILAFKAVVATVDLLGCLLLWLCAVRLRLPTARVLWYAWNPLVILEGAGMGHLDPIGVAAAIAATALLLAAPRARGAMAATGAAIAAGGAAAAGILTKLVPVVAVPAWMLLAATRRHAVSFAAAAGLVSAATLLPIVLRSGGLPPGLVRYGVSWEFNGPLFEPLWRFYDRIDLTQFLKSQVPRLGAEALYPWIYPQLLAKVTLAVLLCALLLLALHRAMARSRPARGPEVVEPLRAVDQGHERRALLAVHRSFAAVMLCTATLYPWYLVWVLPTAALLRRHEWLVLSASMQAAYLPRLVGGELYPSYFLLVWSPFLAAFAWRLWRRRRPNSPTGDRRGDQPGNGRKSAVSPHSAPAGSEGR